MRFVASIVLAFAVCDAAGPAPPRTVRELAAASVAIVHGRVVQHRSAWDDAHQTIWTHDLIEPVDVLRGDAGKTFTVSEPGGVVGDIGMEVSESVPFGDGEEVLVFLKRVPNGMLRVTGNSAGKYVVSRAAAPKSTRSFAADPPELARLKSEIRAAVKSFK